MRERFANWLLCVFIAAFAIILVLLPFHAFLSTWGGSAIGPLLVWKSWKELLLVGLAPLITTYLLLRPDVARLLWSRWINRLILVYVVVHAVLGLTSIADSEAIFAGLAFNLRFLAIFLLAQLIVAGNSRVHRIKKMIMPWLLTTTAVIALMAIAQVTVLPKEFLTQFGYDKIVTIAPYILIDENQNALRAFATMRGPNTLGAYLLLPLALALVLVIDQRRNILAGAALGLGVVALALTGSRSAWLGAGIMIVVLAALWIPPKQLVKWALRVVVPGATLIALLFGLATTVPAVRLAVFHSSPGDESLLEGSSIKHWEATYEGAKDALMHPLGQGVGAAGPASFYSDSPKIAENYFVQIAQEVGIAGLLVFIAINALVFAQFWRQRAELWAKLLMASFVGLTVTNLFLHGWADDPTSMTWWAIAGLYIFAPRQPKKRSSIKDKL